MLHYPRTRRHLALVTIVRFLLILVRPATQTFQRVDCELWDFIADQLQEIMEGEEVQEVLRTKICNKSSQAIFLPSNMSVREHYRLVELFGSL